MNTKRGFATIFPLIIVGIFLVVGGYYFSFQKSKPPTPDKISSSTPITTPTPSDHWQTYINNNITLRIPQDWTFETETDKLISLYNLEQSNAEFRNSIVIENRGQIPEKTIDEFMDRFLEEPDLAAGGLNKDSYKVIEKILIGGEKAWVTRGGCCLNIGKHVFVVHNANLYVLTLLDTNLLSDELTYEDIYDEILSSFKFED